MTQSATVEINKLAIINVTFKESGLQQQATQKIGAVVIPRPPPKISLSDPWRLQEILRGRSPELTMHEIWAYSPSSKTSLPKENRTIRGGSGNVQVTNLYIIILALTYPFPSRPL